MNRIVFHTENGKGYTLGQVDFLVRRMSKKEFRPKGWSDNDMKRFKTLYRDPYQRGERFFIPPLIK